MQDFEHPPFRLYFFAENCVSGESSTPQFAPLKASLNRGKFLALFELSEMLTFRVFIEDCVSGESPAFLFFKKDFNKFYSNIIILKGDKMKYNNLKNILFVCKYNAFRSRFAESYFNKLNKNKSIKAISRGFIMNASSDSVQKRIAKKFNGNILGEPKPIKLNEIIEADLIIVVANDVPKIMFNYALKPISKKVVVWRIKDEQNKNEKNIIKIVKKIQKKVERLIKKLEKELK